MGQFYTLIGLTRKLVPLRRGLHNKNQDNCCNKRLHVCLKEKQARQQNKDVSLSGVQECICFYHLKSSQDIKPTVQVEFREVVNHRSSPTVS